VRANIGTAYFLTGEIERSLASDRITLRSMSNVIDQSLQINADKPSAGMRLVLALANIALRAEQSYPHKELLLTMPVVARDSARALSEAVLEDRIKDIPGLRGRHCKRLNGQWFFVITE
jgi:hypothetical protein